MKKQGRRSGGLKPLMVTMGQGTEPPEGSCRSRSCLQCRDAGMPGTRQSTGRKFQAAACIPRSAELSVSNKSCTNSFLKKVSGCSLWLVLCPVSPKPIPFLTGPRIQWLWQLWELCPSIATSSHGHPSLAIAGQDSLGFQWLGHWKYALVDAIWRDSNKSCSFYTATKCNNEIFIIVDKCNQMYIYSICMYTM